MDDDDLVVAFVEASLPQLAGDREILLETLRIRFEKVPRAAYRQLDLPPRLLEDYLDWFWNSSRLFRCCAGYVERGRRGHFRAWLRRKAKWEALSFIRSANEKGAPVVIGPGNEPPAPDCPDATGKAAAELDAVRACVEKLPPARRVPFKLKYFRAFELTEEDWRVILKWSRRPRAKIEAELLAYRNSERKGLTLAEVGALIGKSEFAVGQAVKRARDAIADKLGGRGGSLE